MSSSEANNFVLGEDEPCSMGELCRYSPANAGVLDARCHICSLSPAHAEAEDKLPECWKPIIKGTRHPKVEQNKRQKARDRRRASAERRQGRDRIRSERVQQSARAERNTERKMVRATKNSGRSFQDGDHVAAGRITLDTKMQSQRTHPVVNLVELAKVRKDAVNAGNLFGALVLRPKNNSGIVAMAEEDFARLIRIIVMHEDINEREQISAGRSERPAEEAPSGLPDPDGVHRNPAV